MDTPSLVPHLLARAEWFHKLKSTIRHDKLKIIKKKNAICYSIIIQNLFKNRKLTLCVFIRFEFVVFSLGAIVQLQVIQSTLFIS